MVDYIDFASMKLPCIPGINCARSCNIIILYFDEFYLLIFCYGHFGLNIFLILYFFSDLVLW